MKKASVAKLREQLSSLLDYVQKGKEVQIEKRNVPIARIVPIESPRANRTKLGAGKGTVIFLKSVIESVMDEDWEMHK